MTLSTSVWGAQHPNAGQIYNRAYLPVELHYSGFRIPTSNSHKKLFNFRFNVLLSIIQTEEPRKFLHEIEYLETVIEYIEKRLVLCDEKDCRQCGRQNRQHVELPDDLQDLEPFEQFDSFETYSDEELFEIVENGLYPKYIYRLDAPEVTLRDNPMGPNSPDLIRFSDPVKAGRCLLFRANLLEQRFERWEIESGVMIFGPSLRQEMKTLVNRAKNLSSVVFQALRRVPVNI